MKVVFLGTSETKIPIEIHKNHNLEGIIQCTKNKSYLKQIVFNITQNIYYRFKKKLSLKKFSQQNNIPYFKYTKRKTDPKQNSNLITWLRKIQPDILVVYSCPYLLDDKIFQEFKIGAINTHASYLPEFRGPNPTFWVYYYQKKFTGITIHHLDKGEDTGNIILQEKIPITAGLTIQELEKQSLKIAIKLILKVLTQFKQNTWTETSQPIEPQTTRAKRLNKKDYENIPLWEIFSTEQVWHCLNGTHDWIHFVKNKTKLFNLLSFTILTYEKHKKNQNQLGHLIFKKSKAYLQCKDGIIHLSYKIDPKKIILKSL
mgnify:CR=1 FL=1|tara:strand:- start:215 stop:1159 length:945 start_codon:yes stop_codon:yes gene_type:complete